MAIFVINEWIWHDSSGENGEDAQQQAFKVIYGLAKSDHQIVVIEGSRFEQKVWPLCKSPSAIVRGLASTYVTTIKLNPDRYILLKPDAVAQLPPDLASSIEPRDHYLARAQLSVEGSVLVTTDKDLLEALRAAGLACMLREAFLDAYFR